MKFNYSPWVTDRKGAFLQRVMEIVPGALSWGILGGSVGLALWKPIAAAVVIIVFDFYWLLRLFYLTIFLLLSFLRLSIEKETDWLARCREIDRLPRMHLGALSANGRKAGFPPGAGKEDAGNQKIRLSLKQGWRKGFSDWSFRKELDLMRKSGNLPPLLDEIYHLVIIPVSGETEKIIRPGIESLFRGHFPSSQIVVVIAIEERSGPEALRRMGKIKDLYRKHFLDMLLVVHPDGLPGEARVKGANVTYAAREAKKYFEDKKIAFENVVVSCFDSDTVVSPDYFTCLTYEFMICSERERASFQPIPVYHNNIWDAPGFARVLEMGASFFQLIEATNPEHLVTFSSHSMSFKALVEVGYWPVDMVSDDSAIFWKALIHYDGHYRVVPLHVTLSMDVVQAETMWKTAVYVYRQKRRWAWGVENFPIVMRAFCESKEIPLSEKIRHIWKLLASHIAWSTWPFLLEVIGWLPAAFAGREFSGSVLYYSAPRITGTIFNLAFLSLGISIVLSLCLLPRKTVQSTFWRRIWHALEWLLVPVIFLFFSAVPALDAQTRLMSGKNMEFWVTQKLRR